jgi:hypothetical protein
VDLGNAVEGEAAASPSPSAPWGCWCSRPVNILSDIWMNASRCINNIYYVMHKFYLRVLFVPGAFVWWAGETVGLQQVYLNICIGKSMSDEHFLYFFYNMCVSHVHFTSLF